MGALDEAAAGLGLGGMPRPGTMRDIALPAALRKRVPRGLRTFFSFAPLGADWPVSPVSWDPSSERAGSGVGSSDKGTNNSSNAVGADGLRACFISANTGELAGKERERERWRSVWTSRSSDSESIVIRRRTESCDCDCGCGCCSFGGCSKAALGVMSVR